MSKLVGIRAQSPATTLAALLAASTLWLVPQDPAQAQRVVELVLDASGSMNAKLPGGETRIAAAVAAVSRVVATLPAETTLAFRAYGHQSPREKHDCDDTALLVPFGPADGARDSVPRAARALTARGYTPISRVLRIAAADLGARRAGAPAGAAEERVILLVSDGKETCDADPCATALALKQADAQLVIHAIGFEVDSAARAELSCLAHATGGAYFDAAGVDGLTKALGAAAVRGIDAVKAIPSKAPGNLEIRPADLRGHRVSDAVTGVVVGEISSFASALRVPPGVYNISFGNAAWRGVEVRPNEKTVLEPAVLVIKGAAMNGHAILDSETGAKLDELSSFRSQAPMLPGLYDVTFGGASWRHVRLDGGQTTVLKPGILHVQEATMSGHTVRDAGGNEVANVSSFVSWLPLPPGSYTIDFGGRAVAFTLAEGQQLELSAKAP